MGDGSSLSAHLTDASRSTCASGSTSGQTSPGGWPWSWPATTARPCASGRATGRRSTWLIATSRPRRLTRAWPCRGLPATRRPTLPLHSTSWSTRMRLLTCFASQAASIRSWLGRVRSSDRCGPRTPVPAARERPDRCSTDSSTAPCGPGSAHAPRLESPSAPRPSPLSPSTWQLVCWTASKAVERARRRSGGDRRARRCLPPRPARRARRRQPNPRPRRAAGAAPRRPRRRPRVASARNRRRGRRLLGDGRAGLRDLDGRRRPPEPALGRLRSRGAAGRRSRRPPPAQLCALRRRRSRRCRAWDGHRRRARAGQGGGDRRRGGRALRALASLESRRSSDQIAPRPCRVDPTCRARPPPRRTRRPLTTRATRRRDAHDPARRRPDPRAHRRAATRSGSRLMDAVDLARLQFGVVTVFHFLIVPTSIGLAFIVAWLQTRYHRTGQERYLRASIYWGKFFLVSFAVGVATGIFQEFQFGMNWSNYSRYVGDVFGGPLAMEGL